MKKFSIFFATLVAVVGLWSCEQDKDPVYQKPTEFVLNQPTLQDQYLELTETGTFTLVCSQPDYGFSAITTYSAEVSLTEDFTSYETIGSTGRGTSTIMTFKSSDLAIAICSLLGITTEDDAHLVPTEPLKVYFRAVAQLDGVESSRIVSNVVYLSSVLPYFAVPQPGYIYLVGQPEGWKGPDEANAEHYAAWRLFEAGDQIGSQIYYGTFEIPAGKAMFRFYTALTGWDADSYGCQVNDSPLDYNFTDNVFVHELVKGKGAYNFPTWGGGTMDIQVNMAAKPMEVVITAHPSN